MFVKIALVRDLGEAGRIGSLLESEGFHPMPVDASAHVTVAGAEQGYHLEVPEAEAEAARAFLEGKGFGRYLVA